MKKSNYIIFTIIVLLASASAYRFGIKVTKDAFTDEYAAVQAMLAFNHLQRYEELSDCLANGMPDETAQKLQMSIINEKELVAKFLRSHNSTRINKYISIRYPQGIESLRSYKSDRGSRWSEPSCK